MIYAVWGSNGSGKTALAMEIATVIGAMGKTVCIISAEDYCEMAIRFGQMYPPENSITEVVKEPQRIRSCCHEVTKNVFFLGASYADTALSLHFTGSQAEILLQTANAIYDIVLVDCTTWKANAITGKAMALSKIIFIPIPAKATAKMWLQANRQTLLQKASSLAYVLNETTPYFDFESMLSDIDITPVASLPYVQDYPALINQGKVICRDIVVSKNAKKFADAIRKLVE